MCILADKLALIWSLKKNTSGLYPSAAAPQCKQVNKISKSNASRFYEEVVWPSD